MTHSGRSADSADDTSAHETSAHETSAHETSAVTPDPLAVNHLTTQVQGPVVLCETPIGPGRRIDCIIGAAQALTTWLRHDALVIVAGPVLDVWELDALLRWCVQLNLVGIWLAADPTPATVAAFRQRAQCIVAIDALDNDVTPSQLASAIADVLAAQDLAAQDLAAQPTERAPSSLTSAVSSSDACESE
jgi:hypothetical protein